MSVFQRATHFNNEGVNALYKGDASTAIQMFTNSIGLMKQALISVQKEQNTYTSDLQYNAVGERSKALLGQTVTVEIYGGVVTEAMDSSMVFNRVIRMPTTTTTTTLAGISSKTVTEMDVEEDIDEFCLTMFVTAAIFNLALANHFMALCTGNDDMMHNKVEKLYAIVLQLLADDSALLKISTGLMIKLACINNLAHIQYSRSGVHDHKECRDELLNHMSYFMCHHQHHQQQQQSTGTATTDTVTDSPMMMFLEDYQDDDEQQQQHKDDIQGLLINALLLLHNGHAASKVAAAA